jgi:glycosyltransferase involved in cell wall biosynthesis
VLLSRRPRPGLNFSIELLVAELMALFSAKGIDARNCQSRYESSGLWPRLYNLVEAAVRRGDVFHVTGDVHYLVGLLPADRTVLTIHDCAGIHGPSTLKKRALRALWFTWPARRAAVVTVVSEATRVELVALAGVQASKVKVVPSFAPSEYRRVDKPFDAECPVVLQVGTAENKNVVRVARALRGLRCKLVIVGRLSEVQLAALRDNAIDYEAYTQIPTAAVRALYEQCDVVMFVSTFEGFGMPIVEGNLVGRPVLTSNVASMPEVARDAALLVDPFDEGSIRAGFLRLIHEPALRNELVARGFENAKRFEPSRIADQYIAIYDEVARSARH